MPKIRGYTYILLCSNGSYYTESTRYLELRVQQHQKGIEANHTQKYGPVELVYYEEHTRIDTAFYREKQIQRWSRAKKKALIEGDLNMLVKHSMAYRDKNE